MPVLWLGSVVILLLALVVKKLMAEYSGLRQVRHSTRSNLLLRGKG